jgi:hypothetical protein
VTHLTKVLVVLRFAVVQPASSIQRPMGEEEMECCAAGQ